MQLYLAFRAFLDTVAFRLVRKGLITKQHNRTSRFFARKLITEGAVLEKILSSFQKFLEMAKRVGS